MLIHGVQLEVDPSVRGLFDGLRTPWEVVERWGAEIPPAGRRSAVKALDLPEGKFFLKIYAYAGAWRLRTVFIVARAGREFRNLKRMRELGFRVPEPVAWGQARTLGFVSESFLLTRAVENAVELRTLIDDPASAPFPLPEARERRRLVVEFARLLRRAHDDRYFIHTLRFKNLLLAREGERYVLYVIDVPFAGIWRHRLFPRRGRVRDLAVLMKGARQLLSRTDRMRFARAYGADRALLKAARAYQETHYP
jgi:hypothetical protein